MKKMFYILILALLFAACDKNTPVIDNPDMIGLPAVFTNKYILTDIRGQNINADVLYDYDLYNHYTPETICDTAKYNQFCINIDFSGNMVSENVYFSDLDISDSPNPYATQPIEQKYYINKITSFKLLANGVIATKNEVYKRDKLGNFKRDTSTGELGYSPLRITLTEAFEEEKWVSFKIMLTDIHENIYVAKTDSIYITK